MGAVVVGINIDTAVIIIIIIPPHARDDPDLNQLSSAAD